MEHAWYWPGEDVNDIPDPLGIEDQWFPWKGTMEGGPSVYAEIFSREYLQNAWDSIQQKEKKLVGKDAEKRPSITFKFVELTGADSERFAQVFGLKDHVERLKVMEPDQLEDNRLGESFLLQGDFSSIRLLVASEGVGDGMPGKWDSGDLREIPQSQMKIALIQSVTGKSGQGTGGSWGEGKKAIAAASRPRVLAAYTCHPYADGDDAGVTRRFMGVTYWRSHFSETRRHRGLGVCGNMRDNPARFSGFQPLQNDEADQFVHDLAVPGFEKRDPLKLEDHGTSYLFVDPSFSPEDLGSAIERNWWPLLELHKLDIEILDFDGVSLEMSPRTQAAIFPFIKAFDIAQGIDRPKEIVELQDEIKVGAVQAGSLALISDVSDGGWSYEETTGGNTNLVALVRNDMVIAYQQLPFRQLGRPPFIRGAFVVSSQSGANETLKMTEGHLHNAWKTDPDQVGSKIRADFARVVLEHIQKDYRTLRSRIAKSEEASDIRIRPFERLFSSKGPSVGRIDPQKPRSERRRDITIQQVSQTVVDYDERDPTRLRFNSIANIAVRSDHANASLEVAVDLGWAVFEEAGAKRDGTLSDAALTIAPKGFSEVNGTWVGELTKIPLTFSWSSVYFPDDWRVVPDPEVTVMEAVKDE